MTQTLTPSTVELTPLQRRGARYAVITISFGALSYLTLTYGLLLLFFTALDLSSARIMLYLAIPPLFDALLRVPMAHLAERVGRKAVGGIGTWLEAVGFALVPLSVLFESTVQQSLMFLGICVFGLGTAMYQSGWFALLSPMTPESIRGRFFGRLRTSWQTLGILFTIACALYLSEDSPIGAFQIVLGAIALAQVGKVIAYARIPEIEAPSRTGQTLLQSVSEPIQSARFMSYCAYVFLLTLATTSAPVLFALVEKRVLHFGDNLVVWLGILGMVGALIGFYLGGKWVDRFGTKPVFLICHGGYSVVMFGFILRGSFGLDPLIVAAAANFAFGLVYAASAMAITTELLALIPPDNKAVSTSICMVLMRGGAGLAGVLCAWAIDLGALAPRWQLWNMPVSRYDALLLACSVTVLLLMVTLGLVPSVMRKAEWVPRPV